MATPTPAPMTRFLQWSREVARVRKSSSPLAGMVVPARLKSEQAVAILGEKVALDNVGQGKNKRRSDQKEGIGFSGEKCLNIVFCDQ